jgi:16S rRNA pseudouridine516 synthase
LLLRLDKFLSNNGFGSRKDVREFFKKGEVTVDGVPERDRTKKINPEVNIVAVQGEQIVYRGFVYIMMNKPEGVVCATCDPEGEEVTVIDILPEQYAFLDLFPVGRLDKDTTGLLIITNDGAYAHRSLSPKKHAEKVYIATLDKPAETSDIAAFESGVTIGDYTCKPAKLEILDGNQAKVTITEGKYHQVKRMFAQVGKNVANLRRIEFAGILLDETLAPGEVRELAQNEI